MVLIRLFWILCQLRMLNCEMANLRRDWVEYFSYFEAELRKTTKAQTLVNYRVRFTPQPLQIRRNKVQKCTVIQWFFAVFLSHSTVERHIQVTKNSYLLTHHGTLSTIPPVLTQITEILKVIRHEVNHASKLSTDLKVTCHLMSGWPHKTGRDVTATVGVVFDVATLQQSKNFNLSSETMFCFSYKYCCIKKFQNVLNQKPCKWKQCPFHRSCTNALSRPNHDCSIKNEIFRSEFATIESDAGHLYKLTAQRLQCLLFFDGSYQHPTLSTKHNFMFFCASQTLFM